ncbi:hypothetical protein C8Q77DRAFT_878112 [Trametes polyzona]|nr:hypothetical protein C8Q77DRAFT_877883 [Trametes polyzona]KAI0633172.1 hypothetical protein C8Q77DRAFT_878112 [Trametes polyzona]
MTADMEAGGREAPVAAERESKQQARSACPLRDRVHRCSSARFSQVDSYRARSDGQAPTSVLPSPDAALRLPPCTGSPAERVATTTLFARYLRPRESEWMSQATCLISSSTHGSPRMPTRSGRGLWLHLFPATLDAHLWPRNHQHALAHPPCASGTQQPPSSALACTTMRTSSADTDSAVDATPVLSRCARHLGRMASYKGSLNPRRGMPSPVSSASPPVLHPSTRPSPGTSIRLQDAKLQVLTPGSIERWYVPSTIACRTCIPPPV